MIYNLTKSDDVEKLRENLNFLYKKKKIIEVRVFSKPRSVDFNAYLHLILNVFAVEYGESLTYVKKNIFKKLVNPDIFVVWVYINGKKIPKLKSTKDLTTAELHICMERFKNFCAKELGWWFPEFDDDLGLGLMEDYINNNKQWL